MKPNMGVDVRILRSACFEDKAQGLWFLILIRRSRGDGGSRQLIESGLSHIRLVAAPLSGGRSSRCYHCGKVTSDKKAEMLLSSVLSFVAIVLALPQDPNDINESQLSLTAPKKVRW